MACCVWRQQYCVSVSSWSSGGHVMNWIGWEKAEKAEKKEIVATNTWHLTVLVVFFFVVVAIGRHF